MSTNLIKLATVCLVALSLSACGNAKTICNKTSDTYGAFSTDDEENPNIKYKVIAGNVVWSILLIETVIAPVYFIGFSLFEPVEARVPCSEFKNY